MNTHKINPDLITEDYNIILNKIDVDILLCILRYIASGKYSIRKYGGIKYTVIPISDIESELLNLYSELSQPIYLTVTDLSNKGLLLVYLNNSPDTVCVAIPNHTNHRTELAARSFILNALDTPKTYDELLADSTFVLVHDDYQKQRNKQCFDLAFKRLISDGLIEETHEGFVRKSQKFTVK